MLALLLLVMCTYPFAKKAAYAPLARGEGRERYFDCNLMQRKVLASSHQHLMAEAPVMDQYAPIPNILLSKLQSQPFAQYAKEHGGASWTSVSIDFEPLQLSVKLGR